MNNTQSCMTSATTSSPMLEAIAFKESIAKEKEALRKDKLAWRESVKRVIQTHHQTIEALKNK